MALALALTLNPNPNQGEGEYRVPEVRRVDAVVVELLQREAVEGGVDLVRARALASTP